MENISFQYPTWYLIFCALLGLAYAGFLYYRDSSFREQSKTLNWILGPLRFLTVTFLSILLLSPLLRSIVSEAKKPVVILAQDQSESIGAAMTEEQKAAYQTSFKALSQELAAEYDLHEYAFGNEVREGVDFEFTDKVTNVSKLLQELYDLYSNQNLGAVILATDGIYNEGSNPIYGSTRLAAPIYTIALGDTTAQKDLFLKRIFHNKIAYLGDKFSIQADVAARNCAGKNTNLSIYKVGAGAPKLLQKIPININKTDFFTTKEIILDADQSGVQRYRVSLGTLEDESSTVNNSKDFFVDILDARQKILLMANAPHPDITAIKQSLESNKNYEIETAYIQDQNVNAAAYDFVVLHQLPSKTNSAEGLLGTLNNKKIPRLFITGSQSNYSKLNEVQSILRINSDGRNTNEVQASVAGDFSLFNLDAKIGQDLPRFPPIIAPFGEFKDNGIGQTMLYQRIGKVDTKYPLLLFGEERDIKTGLLCAENIWKWRLFDFLQNKNHDRFDELLGKVVQYLSLKEDKRKFRVSQNKNIFKENEPIFFDAELYNESYELINEPDAFITVKNSEGKDYNFTFSKAGRSYSLNAGNFPVGNYSFEAKTMSSGKALKYNGQFSVQPIQLEVYETTADHSTLQLLSEQNGGEMLYAAQLSSITQKLKDRKTVVPVIYESSKTRSVINLRWIFFILLALLSLEWIVRRFYGEY